MEFVPLEFCDSVATLLTTYPRKTFTSDCWQSAIDAHFKNRINVELSFGHQYGWSYSILVRTDDETEYVETDDEESYDDVPYEDEEPYDEITFEELENLNPQNLRICRVLISPDTQGQHGMFEEMIELVKFTLPFVNRAELTVSYSKDFEQDDIVKLISLFDNSSIGELFTGDNGGETWDALRVHLKSDCLKTLSISHEEITTELKSAVSEYLEDSTFEYFWSSCLELLDLDLFKYLFSKPQTEPRWKLYCMSSIDIEELRDFEKHLQVWSISNNIKWKREDGLVVELTQHTFLTTYSSISFQDERVPSYRV